jgi:hypothetical protein
MPIKQTVCRAARFLISRRTKIRPLPDGSGPLENKKTFAAKAKVLLTMNVVANKAQDQVHDMTTLLYRELPFGVTL